MRIIKVMFYILLIVIGVSFSVLNATPIQVDYYFIKVTWPISLSMIMSFGAGILVCFILVFSRMCAAKFEIKRLKRKIQLTNNEREKIKS